jgi:hypothetical protein
VQAAVQQTPLAPQTLLAHCVLVVHFPPGATPHAPLEQASPTGHALPQPPQFMGSVVGLTQPLQ